MRVFAPTVLVIFMVVLPVRAQAVSFDDLQEGEDVLEYYNGGFGSLGSGPGDPFGLSFTPGWIAFSPDVYGPDGKAAHIGPGVSIVSLHTTWATSIQFYYLGDPLTVNLYDQEGGLGTLLDTRDLAGQPGFDPMFRKLDTTFRSAVFISSGSNIIDTLVFSEEGEPPRILPEPGTLGLSLLSMGFLSLRALLSTRR